MEFDKSKVYSYDWDKIIKGKFIPVSFEELKVGDIVKSITFTYSQKYLLDDLYEEYNMEKIGVLLTKDEEYRTKSKIYRLKAFGEDYSEFEIENLYVDAGSSGGFEFFKLIL